MKKVLFLTNGVHVQSNGRSIASYGYCCEFSKYTSLKAISSLPFYVDPIKASTEKQKSLDLEYVKEKKKSIWNVLTRLKDILIFKTVGIIEIRKPNTYNAAVQYIKSNRVDIVIIDHLALARFFFYLKKRFPKLIYVYNSHNAEAINYYQQITGKNYIVNGTNNSFNSLFDRFKYRYISNAEKRMLQETDYTITISQNDRELLSEQYGISPQKILHTRPLTRFERVKTIEDVKEFHGKFLIVGSMNWYPNVRGVIWFIDEIFIDLIKTNPEYKLYIVGRSPTTELKKRCERYADNIILTGSVDSTAPYFKECDISIVPVFEGTGIKIKVLESIERGIPTICSVFASKDYDDEGQIAIAKTKEDWIEHIHAIAGSKRIREEYFNKMVKYSAAFFELTEDMKKLFVD